MSYKNNNLEYHIENINIPLNLLQSKALLLIGPSCVGKTVIARGICNKIKKFTLLTPITTREKKLSDVDKEIILLSNDEFEEKARRKIFFYIHRKDYGLYGYSIIELSRLISKGFAVIIMFRSIGGISFKHRISNIPTIFIKAPINILIERLMLRKESRLNRKILEKDLKYNAEAYNYFRLREKCCIEIENSIDEKPAAKSATKKAILFCQQLPH